MEKNQAAVSLGRLGGKKREENLKQLSPEEYKAFKQKAVNARWKKYRKEKENAAK